MIFQDSPRLFYTLDNVPKNVTQFTEKMLLRTVYNFLQENLWTDDEDSRFFFLLDLNDQRMSYEEKDTKDICSYR